MSWQLLHCAVENPVFPFQIKTHFMKERVLVGRAAELSMKNLPNLFHQPQTAYHAVAGGSLVHFARKKKTNDNKTLKILIIILRHAEHF